MSVLLYLNHVMRSGGTDACFIAADIRTLVWMVIIYTPTPKERLWNRGVGPFCTNMGAMRETQLNDGVVEGYIASIRRLCSGC